MTLSAARPLRRRLYVDSSAYLSMLVDEVGSAALARETSGAELLSSVLLVLETKRNLVRFVRERGLTAEHYRLCIERVEQDVALFVLRDLTLDLCESTTMPPVTTPRSLDLVHIRTALAFHAEQKIDRFVTLDVPQRDAAKELGLPV